MKRETFDKVAALAIISSILFTAVVATSWNWFPTPGDWGDIARIPKKILNYIALLLPLTITFISLVSRRLLFRDNIKDNES